jgi:hypothetical protein
MEEEIIFPAIRSALPENTRGEILREIQERRKQGSQAKTVDSG